MYRKGLAGGRSPTSPVPLPATVGYHLGLARTHDPCKASTRLLPGNPQSSGRGGNAFSSAEMPTTGTGICGPQRYRLVQQSPRHVS